MIEIRELKKSFGPQLVLDGVTLSIHEGETCVVMGRSGSGKSVILKHLIGLLHADSGSILVDDEDITGLEERELTHIRRKVGMLFQSGALFDSMSVEENLAFPLLEQGVTDKKIIDEKVAEALELVSLAGEQKKMPENLSGGMRKRVGLARTIVGRPRCVLYDEPTTGLDPIGTDSINHLIRRLQKRLAVTSVVVTHDLKTAFSTADRIAFLHEGKIYFTGTPKEMQESADPIISNFLNGISEESEL